ncbi:MFS transporter [Brevundimonas sp.]|uniref:spinster family MFS transporter n=1 Tax=Brevundimonas sp. TaxID=1871086 RepID=UPI0019C42380|nr:MFS transporter [Brevundimonas sp.]MBD3837582.1 MFS transporter [Brevundimonas sp.]
MLPPLRPAPPTGLARLTQRPNFVLGLLILIYTFNVLDRQIVSILAQPIKAEMGLSDTQLGLLTGLAFALFYSVFGIPVGWLADRFGRVRTMAASCIVWSVCSIACGFSQNFAQMAAARMGVGVGEAGGAPPSYSLISDYFPPHVRAQALGLFSLGAPLGILLGMTLGGWAAVEFGWRAAFYVVSLPGVFFALLLWLLVKEPKAGRLDTETKSIEVQAPLAVAVREFFTTPALWRVAVAGGLSAFVTYGLLNWLPSFLMRTKGMALGEVAQYLGFINAGAMALGLWFGGRLADRLGRRNPAAYGLVPAASLVLAAPAFVAAVIVPGWAPSVLLFAIPIALNIVFMGPALAVVQNGAKPANRTVASALFLLINNLVGLGGGPLFIGFVSDLAAPRYGDNALIVAMLALTPVFLLAALAHYLVARALRTERYSRLGGEL